MRGAHELSLGERDIFRGRQRRGTATKAFRASDAGDGFDVQLFEEQRCGCGPHPTFGLTVHVQRNGATTIRDKKVVFRDMSTACVD